MGAVLALIPNMLPYIVPKLLVTSEALVGGVDAENHCPDGSGGGDGDRENCIIAVGRTAFGSKAWQEEIIARQSTSRRDPTKDRSIKSVWFYNAASAHLLRYSTSRPE
jgi:hypothetical protein